MLPAASFPELTVDTVIRVGVPTPHEVPGPEVEFAAMTPGRLATRVARITGPAEAGRSGGPVSPAALGPLTTAPSLDRAAGQLLTEPVEVIGYASTTSAYTIGFDAEMAMVARLSQMTGRPVAATCASAVHALRVLQVERAALIGAPWFDPQFNELGAAYFASQGFGVVSSVPAGLSHDPRGRARRRLRMGLTARSRRRASSLHRRQRLQGRGSNRSAGNSGRPPCAHLESGIALAAPRAGR
jgi:maleate cis-trans isomerase